MRAFHHNGGYYTTVRVARLRRLLISFRVIGKRIGGLTAEAIRQLCDKGRWQARSQRREALAEVLVCDRYAEQALRKTCDCIASLDASSLFPPTGKADSAT